MGDSFYFLDGIKADKTSKRRMRSHVMKGKNAGRRLHRPSKLTDRTLPRWPNTCISRSIILQKCETCNNAICLPVTDSPTAVKIINDFYTFTCDRIYPSKLGIQLHDAKVMWLQDLFTDEATYSCSVALMQACNEIYMSNGDTSPKASYYLNHTLAHVRYRLQSEKALSNSTLAIVLSLINQELIRNHDEAAAAHFEGLKALVNLRGGLDQLEGKLSLVLKTCKTDILFALRHGGPTAYFRDRVPDSWANLTFGVTEIDRKSISALARDLGLDPPLHRVLADVMCICSLFNTHRNDFTIDLTTFQELIISLCGRLLRYRTLKESRQKSDVQSAYHLGLILFIMTTFLQHEIRRILEYNLISVCLRDILDKRSQDLPDDFVLWLVLVGGVWTVGSDSKEWLSRMIRSKAQILGLTTWAEAQVAVSKYPWMKVLHDRPGFELWNIAQRVH